MTALGSFSAPYVFGGGFRVMTTQIVATKLNGELPLAMVETVALALVAALGLALLRRDRKSTRLNSSHTVISYAVFCLKKKKRNDETYLTVNKQERYAG